MGRLDKSVVVVTGGAKGIGRTTCELLASEGAQVAIADIDDPEGELVVAGIRAIGGNAAYWHVDVADEDQIAKVFTDIEHCWGRIDVLVNNAGIVGADKPTHELTLSEFRRVLDVNVLGVFLCTRQVLPGMRARSSGSIINLSSIYGLVGAADIPPYHASKGAVRLMSKTDALLYAKDNIRVNSVHPGFIWTPMVSGFATTKGDTDTVRAGLAALHPLGRLGEALDVAYGILYLASDESKFVTGSELVIDGGYTAR